MTAERLEGILLELGFQLTFEGENKGPLHTVHIRSYGLEYHGWYIEFELDHDDERSWLYFDVSYEKDNDDARFFIDSGSIADLRVDETEEAYYFKLPWTSEFRIEKAPRQR